MIMQVGEATRGEVIEAVNCAVESLMMDARGGVISWRDAEQKLAFYARFAEASGYEALLEYTLEQYLVANTEAIYEASYPRLTVSYQLDKFQQ